MYFSTSSLIRAIAYNNKNYIYLHKIENSIGMGGYKSSSFGLYIAQFSCCHSQQSTAYVDLNYEQV